MNYVLVSIKLDNEWNEWTFVGGFSFNAVKGDSAKDAARRARQIVDHKGQETVEVQVLNRETKLYDQEFTFTPIKF